MKKALYIGAEDAPQAVEALRGIFAGRYAIEVGNHPFEGYDALILDGAVKDAEKAALVTYVAWGGRLLSLRKGLTAAGSAYEIELLHCARICRENPCATNDYIPADTQFPPFSIMEASCQFIFDPMHATTPLLFQQYAQTQWPAAWAHSWCLGKVACVAAGETAAGLEALAPLLTHILDWFDASGEVGT